MDYEGSVFLNLTVKGHELNPAPRCVGRCLRLIDYSNSFPFWVGKIMIKISARDRSAEYMKIALEERDMFCRKGSSRE